MVSLSIIINFFTRRNMKVNIMIGNTYSKENDGYAVFYRITDCRGTRILISSGIYTHVKFSGDVFPSQEQDATAKTERVRNVMDRIERFCRLNKDLYGRELKERIAKSIGAQLKQASKPKLFTDFMKEYSSGMKASTKKLYDLTAERISCFDRRARLTDIDRQWLEGFESYLRNDGLSVNGIAQKMRNIRTVMNACRNDGYSCQYPFIGNKGYRIREEHPVPNDLTAQEFAKLRDYPCDTWQRVYRDLFCLSFYFAGIDVGDLLLCRGLKNGRLVFTRRKTDKVNASRITPISLPVYPEAMEIIERYRGRSYLLNVMDNMSDYHTFMQHWNKALKKIGPSRVVPDKIGKMRKVEYMPMFPHITTKSARYSFASIAANDLDISEQVIGKCLGHTWAGNVTSRYISHDQKKIDNAIRSVIDYVNGFR